MRRFGRYLLIALGALVLAVFAVGWIAKRAVATDPVAIDFTRYLAAPVVAGQAGEFVAEVGAGRLLVQCGGDGGDLLIRLNGALAYQAPVGCGAATSIPVQLQTRNTVEVVGAAVEVRVKQQSTVQLNVISRVHFNVNVRSFAASRAFYGDLGFTTLSGFPDTNTQAMARAIGIATPTTYDGSQGDHAGGYLLHGELISLGLSGGVIDLIEFTIPRDESPPYAQINHLGMAYSVLHSANLQADYDRLTAQGIAFLSAPVTRANGEQFAVFKDPDGVFYELRQATAQALPAAAADAASQIVALGPLGVNVSDFERSAAWYEMFGYQLQAQLPISETAEAAAAYGLPAPVRRRGAVLRHQFDGSTMELVQWLAPASAGPPYPIPVNHIGIHRTALATSDIAADVATLRAQGVEFISEPTPCCSGPDSSGSIVAFYDPDGVIVELVEQPLMTWLTPVMVWVGNTFGND